MPPTSSRVHAKMNPLKLTVLYDLDGTLLKNDFNAFLPAYLNAFSKTMTGLPEEVFVSNLMLGTRQMISNQDPTQTLQETFDKAFFSAVKIEKSNLEPIINHFYEEVFPTLHALTAPLAESKNLVQYTLQHHPHTVIATNPLFPFTATAQRLTWADISAQDYPYSLVTTYETFHFSKPHGSYYAEILGKLGWPENLAVMIGNDLEEDIRPASTLGLPTYWVTTASKAPNFERHPLSAQGDLTGIIPWLEKVSQQADNTFHCSLTGLPHLIRSTPAVFDSLLNRDHSHPLSPENPVYSNLLSELVQAEQQHLEDLNHILDDNRLAQTIHKNPPAGDREVDDLDYYFRLRLTLLDAVRNLSAQLNSLAKYGALLQTIARTDQALIRKTTKLLAA